MTTIEVITNMKRPIGRKKIARLQEEIRHFGSMTPLVFWGSLLGAAIPMAYLAVVGMILFGSEILAWNLNHKPEPSEESSGNWLLLAAILCWVGSTLGAGFVTLRWYRRSRMTKAWRALRWLDEEDQRSVLLPLFHDRGARKMAQTLMTELGLPVPSRTLPTELLPSAPPPGRGDEVGPTG